MDNFSMWLGLAVLVLVSWIIAYAMIDRSYSVKFQYAQILHNQVVDSMRDNMQMLLDINKSLTNDIKNLRGANDE